MYINGPSTMTRTSATLYLLCARNNVYLWFIKNIVVDARTIYMSVS